MDLVKLSFLLGLAAAIIALLNWLHPRAPGTKSGFPMISIILALAVIAVAILLVGYKKDDAASSVVNTSEPRAPADSVQTSGSVGKEAATELTNPPSPQPKSDQSPRPPTTVEPSDSNGAASQEDPRADQPIQSDAPTGGNMNSPVMRGFGMGDKKPLKAVRSSILVSTQPTYQMEIAGNNHLIQATLFGFKSTAAGLTFQINLKTDQTGMVAYSRALTTGPVWAGGEPRAGWSIDGPTNCPATSFKSSIIPKLFPSRDSPRLIAPDISPGLNNIFSVDVACPGGISAGQSFSISLRLYFDRGGAESWAQLSVTDITLK